MSTGSPLAHPQENRVEPPLAVRLAAPAVRARRSLLASIHRSRMREAQVELTERHGAQAAAWHSRARQFASVFSEIEARIAQPLVHPMWQDYAERIRRSLTDVPPLDFLRIEALTDTMVMVVGGHRFKSEMQICERVWSQHRLAQLAEEDLAGDPVLHCRHPLTSHTRIHHLHTLARHHLAVGPKLPETSVVLEWGGGFGGMARLIRRMAHPKQTLILVELPILTAVQWLYLGVTLGEQQIHLVDRPGAGIVEGRVNLVPNGLLDEIDLEPDLFLSTWALGESQLAALELCEERGWLDAPHIVIADQRRRRQQNSNRLLQRAGAHGASLEPVPSVPGSFFAFR